MKILLISKEIFPNDQTGLGIATKKHYEILKKKGYAVKIVTRNKKKNSDFIIEINNLFDFFLNFSKLKKRVKEIIKSYEPDYIIIESLQTLISELFLFSSNKKKIILISHGISIFPYKNELIYIFRFLIYLIYLPFLFILLAKVDCFFSLNWTNKSNRYIDENSINYLKKKNKIF